MVDTGGEVRSPICRTAERGAWGEGTKDEAIYYKSAARFEHAETQSQTRSGTICSGEVEPSPALACSCAQIVPVSCPRQPHPGQLLPTQSN